MADEKITPDETPSAAANNSSSSDSSAKRLDPTSSAAAVFPEHATGERFKATWKERLIGLDIQEIKRARCKANVQKVLQNSAPVKLLVAAMKSVGCPVDPERHISCQLCHVSVHGGFDPSNKQIVVCHNIATTEGKVTSVLAHELIHAFDYCRSTFDFNNIDHIACSEVRASAITHCSFLSAAFGGDASPFNFKNRHMDCVRVRATESVRRALDVPLEEALGAVERVFPKCYRDLEPFGRIPRRNSRDCERAYFERIYYGYVGT